MIYHSLGSVREPIRGSSLWYAWKRLTFAMRLPTSGLSPSSYTYRKPGLTSWQTGRFAEYFRNSALLLRHTVVLFELSKQFPTYKDDMWDNGSDSQTGYVVWVDRRRLAPLMGPGASASAGSLPSCPAVMLVLQNDENRMGPRGASTLCERVNPLTMV